MPFSSTTPSPHAQPTTLPSRTLLSDFCLAWSAEAPILPPPSSTMGIFGRSAAPKAFPISAAVVATATAAAGSDGHDDDADKDLQNWSSLIGIVTAIVGNVLIALALNVQRYAHIRLHRERNRVRRQAKEALRHAQNGSYGTLDVNSEARHNGARAHGRHHDDDGDGDYARESDHLTQSFHSQASSGSDTSGDDTNSTYLQSPYWWLGQILITVGELGNFLAYGFAPASIVSPLGVVALVSNCIIAPILFKESFRQRDFGGVIIAVAGVVTVVLSANTQETKLDPHDVWDHITTIEFEVYLAVTMSLIAVLMWASPRYGNRTILIDLGLVGLFGESILASSPMRFSHAY